jgi:hypothetical protein
MEIPIINIGHSRGIILKKTILDRYHIGDIVDLDLRKNHIHIKPLAQPRKGWGNAFNEMNEKGDDNLIII